VPAVAVGITMVAYDAMFKPHCHFIGWVGIVFLPKADVIHQVPQLNGYLPIVYTNVLVGFAKLNLEGLFNFFILLPLLVCSLGTGILTKMFNSSLGGKHVTAVLTSFL
jgi:hypothetical protein